MKNKILKLVAKLTAIATIATSVMTVAPARAASLTSSKDTLSRIAISTTANHTVVFTLPTGVTLDASGTVDTLRVDFPHTSAFTQSGTWVAGDFTFSDGTAAVISNVTQGAGTIDCTPTGGADDVCVAIDTTGHVFTVEVGAAYTASAAAATITFTIAGTAGDGTLTNPGTAGSYSTVLSMCDETASCTSSFTTTHTSSVGIAIADSDQVSVTASVDPSLTFDIDTSVADGETSAPYTVPLGTLTTTNSKISGSTDSVNMIILEADTNAAGGVAVTVQNANGVNGLVSTSVPADNIGSADGTQANGTENYGLCVATAALSGFTIAGSYSGDTCALNGEGTNVITGLTTSAANMLSTTGPVAAAHAEVVVNAGISGTTVAHSDYADTLTFIATATF